MPEETALVEYADYFLTLITAELWAENKEGFRMRIARVKRQAALRVCFIYNIVYEPVVLVIRGDIPVELGEKGNLPETRRYRQGHCQIRRTFANLTLVET
ncbi:hypothetical protein J6590_086859 [Homalodisca vitripennis]|nr:hypothetical protein J6590_086859 [Homalodisca vitripennis]